MQQNVSSKQVAIVGAGVVGTAVGYLLKQSGYEIVGVAGRSPATLERARRYLGVRGTRDVTEAAGSGSIVLVGTGDDQIRTVCQEIAEHGGFQASQTVLHFSGALTLDVLEPARQAGAAVASLHPVQTFADVDSAVELIPGSVFGVTSDKAALSVALELVKNLGGEAIEIAEEDRSLYHAAACMASNYLVTIGMSAAYLYSLTGASRETAFRALLPLMEGTLKNLASKKSAGALTGPIARGDLRTVQRHLKALKERAPELVELYIVLGRSTAEVACEKGTLSQQDRDRLLEILADPAYPQ